MTRSTRARSDASQPQSPTTRRSVQLSPRQSTKLDDHREGVLRSPTSPTIRKTPRLDLADELLPSTPEEWIIFAQTKLRRAAATLDMADTILDFAEIEPDLLEFLLAADEEIRETISEALCGLLFPNTCEAWKESIVGALLERFQAYFGRLPLKLVSRKVDEEGRRLPYLTTALEALDHLGLGDLGDLEGDDEKADSLPKFRNKTQKRRKTSVSIANQAHWSNGAVDPRVFKAAEVDFPASHKEAMSIQSALLLRLREVLKMYLASFAKQGFVDQTKALYLKVPVELLPSTSASATMVDDAGAFSRIQPLASAKYFDEDSLPGEWPVLITKRAMADLRRMRKRDSPGYYMVNKKLEELSEGFFSDSNQKRLVGLGTEVPIYEAKVSRDMRIVYQIDIRTDEEAKFDEQVIKIYGVYTHAQLDNRMWSQISHSLEHRGKEYRQRCLYRETHRAPGQNVTCPARFPHQEGSGAPIKASSSSTRAQRETTGDIDDEDLDLLYTLGEFVPMSQSLITPILNDKDHSFRPSDKEKEVIYHDSSCFVLGRSGTGKTTCIVFKMLGIEILFESMVDVAKPRQVFVTQSRMLAQRVQEHYQKIMKGSFGMLTELNLDEPEEEVLADLEDEDDEAFGLPPKYSMLEDHHFPLFLSFDQLCSLLEADFGLEFGQVVGNKAGATARGANATSGSHQESQVVQPDPGAFFDPDFVTELFEHERIKKAKQAMITFDKFLVAYWPRFDHRLKKGFDPALVYSEFLGVIEGSEAALDTESGALSREEYTEGRYRRSSFASQREYVYDLYEAYCIRRGQLGHCDVAQRTHALVKAMKSRVPGKKLDCLYAQDNLLIDIKLLHTLSSNPHGIFMAGDTAQTISAGSSFRFEDLKAFMWRLEEQNKAVQAKKRKAIHSTLFHLAVNYRSHRGIVDCASSIVLLVSELFPDSIDRLQKESGLDDGPPPIFFSGWERGVTQFERFLRSGKNGSINFGASQAILVRNDAAREALRHRVGNIGVILTLYESKGLEFDDVLLYNFFEDSLPELATWRIVLTGIAPVPDFDELRHSVICAELKHLYVGLTRARKNCWIWDMSETAEAIKEFWSAYGLVTHHGPGDPVPQLGVSSTKDAWEKRGRSFFHKELYSQAVFCFEKADMVVERDIATAYESRKQARLSHAAGFVDKAHQSFLEAAERYLQCARSSKGKQQKSCYLRAAECFAEIEDWKSTAEAFLWAGNFDLAAKNFRRAGCFDEAVGVVKSHRDHMQEEVVGELIEVAKLEYLRTQKFEQAEELFDDLDKELESMEGYGLGTAQIHVLERQERYEEAAEVAFTEHNTMEGIRLLLRSNTPGSVRHVVEKSLNSLWILLPFRPLDDNRSLESTVIASLIQHLRDVKSRLKRDEAHQFEVFRALYAQNQTRLLELAQSYAILGNQAGTRGRLPAPLSSALSLLCFSSSSNLLIPAKGWTIPEFVRKSKLSLLYFSQLLHLGRTLDLSTPSSQKLMGLEVQKSQATREVESGKSVSTEFWVHSPSMIFDEASSVPGVLEPTSSDLGPSFLVLAEVDAHRLTRSAIYEALRFEIQKTTINDMVDHSQHLEPCLGYAIFGRCNREECSKQEVNSLRLPEGQRQEAFNLRVQALVSQLEIIRVYPPENVSEYRVLTRTWICKAYELFMPHFPPIGSVVCIDPARVPEIITGFNIIAMWCADALHYTEPKVIYGSRMLSYILAYLDLAFRVKSTSTKFEAYVYGLHSTRLVEPRADLMLSDETYPHSPYSIVHDFINLYGRKTGNALGRVIRAMLHIVTQRVSIEANVLVHTLEFIGREVIVHYRRWSGASEGITIFDRMLVPQSWALDLVTQPALMLQRGFHLSDFWHTLYNAIALLHSYEPSAQAGPPRTLFGFNSSLTFLVRSILIMRICRLLVIVASNIGVPLHEKDAIRLKVSSLLSESGNLHTMCTRFANTQSWMDFQSALEYSPLNRGADEMVFLTLRRNSLPPPSIRGAKTISYVNIFPDLAQRLALNGATKHAGASFNPPARSSSYSTPAHAPPGSQTGGRADIDMFASTVPSHSNYSPSASSPEIRRILTANEVDMGKKILFCYRMYTARRNAIERAHATQQQVETQRAAQIIWKYYYRYRLRHLAPQTSIGVKIRKLHAEYMHDVDRIVCPPIPVECLRLHKRVLLGCMPHVLVYLHGLEEANRQEQDSKKKALLTANHRYLEKLQSRIRRCGVFAKKIKSLINDLSPGSSRLRHFDSLQGRVKRAADARLAVIQVFGKDAISVDLELHYVLGVEVILAQPPITTQHNPRH